LHYASDNDPVYYFLNEKIYIKPASGTQTFSILEHGDVTNWDSGTSSIAYMPSHHYNQVIMYAAIQLLEHKLSTLSDEQVEEMLQVKLNKANEKQLETEKLLNMANTDIERLERENTHLRQTLEQYTLKPSDTKLRALVDKFVEKAKEYKIQSPIIRK